MPVFPGCQTIFIKRCTLLLASGLVRISISLTEVSLRYALQLASALPFNYFCHLHVCVLLWGGQDSNLHMWLVSGLTANQLLLPVSPRVFQFRHLPRRPGIDPGTSLVNSK